MLTSRAPAAHSRARSLRRRLVHELAVHVCTTCGTTGRSMFWRSRRPGPAKVSASSFRRCWHGRNRAIIYDIKGENWAKTAGFRAQQGHLCFKFSPVEESSSSRFNPLAEVRLFTPRDVSDAQNIANMIVRTGEDSPQERYWQDAAASITTGMILHVCYEAALEGRVACLADLAHVFTRPGAQFRETLEELMNFEHDPDFQHAWRMPTRRTNADTSGRSGESAGDARQRGPGFWRRPLHCENGTDPLQRSAGREEHLRQRLHHQRPGEP